jgi:acyl carrier protein
MVRMVDNAHNLTVNALERVLERRVSLASASDLDSQALRDLGLSSLQLFEFVSVLEEMGGFTFDDADIHYENFSTVGKVVTVVLPYLQSRGLGSNEQR